MSKDKITEILEDALSDGDKPEGKIQHDNKLAVMGDGTTINIMESPASKEEKRYDDSAERQGRKKVSLRQYGDVVDPKHMTPKEFRNFNAGIWDGIEKRDGIYNWTAHTWERKENKPVSRRDADRRQANKKYIGQDKRKSKRREQDKVDHKKEAVLYYSAMAIGYGIVFAAYLTILWRYAG